MKLPGSGQPQGGRRVEKKGKKALIALICVLAVLVLAVGGAGAWVYLYGNIYPGVTAGGIDLSGLSRPEALSALETAFAAQNPGDSLDITVGEYTKSLDLSGVGAQYDARQTAENAYLIGRTGTLFDRVGSIWHAMTAGVTSRSTRPGWTPKLRSFRPSSLRKSPSPPTRWRTTG